MLKLINIRIENAEQGVTTDNSRPRFSFALQSDQNGCCLEKYRIVVSNEQETVWDSGELLDKRQIGIAYNGQVLRPFSRYAVTVTASDNYGETASGSAAFSTGRLNLPWRAQWITDNSVSVPDKSSPCPLLFRKQIVLSEEPVKAWICASALGIYDLAINGEALWDRYFAPGFTSYGHQIQYQTCPVAGLKRGENEITARVGAGWAVGAFTITRTNQTYAKSQSLLAELHVVYADGRQEVIGSDDSWLVSGEGRLRFADWYDGEVYDATIDETTIQFKPAHITSPRGNPRIVAEYGAPVKAIQTLTPVVVFATPDGETIYDFGQNFAGVISAQINGQHGQKVVFRHAEVLEKGELFVKGLRTAKATVEYICTDGLQTYSPTMTYMGFRYVGVSGIDKENLVLSAKALSSVVAETGSFRCSDARLNQLQSNIQWSGRSNFVDIPTDCPQRDERMGWTGDIAIFARTACFNFDMSRFFDKWLRDLSAEQIESGALPLMIPQAGDNWKIRATGCWGDACVLVPWAEYLARGDEELLRRQYPTMKLFLKECERRAGLFSIGKHKRIWSLPFQFGDWCAPGEDFIRWILKGKWMATAYFANSCHLVSTIAEILGETQDAGYYKALYHEISDAYMSLLCKRDGSLKKEFQTAYVLPLYFSMAHGSKRDTMAERLARLVEAAGYRPRTGFPGTPYLLFALADNGQADAAFRTLLNEGCPGWLYAVKAGATTVWESWDALKPNGTVNMGECAGNGGMVSFNHYANGAVGDFLYRRVAGLEAVSGGYKSFRIAPMPCGGLTEAEASVRTPYGTALSSWKIQNNTFTIRIQVPVSTSCSVTLPSGKTQILQSGSYTLSEAIKEN